MDKNAALCVYLKKYHTGKGKAVPSTELEQLFSVNGRSLRRKINRLRQDGVPICSDRSGYYFAANQEEVNATVFRLTGLVTKISNARTGLLYSSLLGELPLPIEVTIQMAKQEGVSESLKAENQMRWVGLMNNIRAAAEEIVLTELVYR